MVLAHDHRRGEGEGEGERHRHHHHHAHGEGEGETGHDHSDHGGRHGPWYCESRHRYLKVNHNTVTIGKKRSNDADVTTVFTLQSIIEKNSHGEQVVGSGLIGVQHTHAFDFTTCDEESGCVMFGDLDRDDWYKGYPVCHIEVTFVLSKQYGVKTSIDFYFFKGEGIIRDGPKRTPSFYEVTTGTVKMEITQKKWRWCKAEKQNCVIKQRHVKTYDVGTYLDFQISALTPTAGIQCPDDNTLWYVGGGAYMYVPHNILVDWNEWQTQLDGRPIFAMPSLNSHLPPFDDILSWSILLTFAEPRSGWRPGGPAIPPIDPPVVISSSASSPPTTLYSSSSAPLSTPSAFSSSAASAPPSFSSSAAATPPAFSSSAAPSVPVESSSTGESDAPPAPPTPPCSGAACGDSSTDPFDDPEFNPFPNAGSSSSTGGVAMPDTTTGSSNGGADSSTGAPAGPIIFDCLVGDWTSWMTCDVTCGMGSQTRTRDVTQLPSMGGAVCPTLFEVRTCDPEPPLCAEADCQVGPWSYWTVCTGACGAQNRSRIVTVPMSMGGGVCPHLMESRVCRQMECLLPGGLSPEVPNLGDTTGLEDVHAVVFATQSANGWWIALAVVAWVGVILGVNEYITRLWDRPKIGAAPAPAEADALMPH